MIESLLAKPSKKPQFKDLAGTSDVLKRAKAFMPEFIHSTDKILSCPSDQFSMDIQINDIGAADPTKFEQEAEEVNND